MGWLITLKARHQAASLALWATLVLTVLKLGAAWLSHSVGVLSEAIHSALDLTSAAVSYFSIREAGKPADEKHPFGHGKIETLSSLFESLLLVVAAALIFYEGVDHLLHPQEVVHTNFAVAVMAASIGLSYYVFLNNSRVADQTESSALQVNSIHFLSDVISSVGVLVALVLLRLTDWLFIDSLIAFSVAIYILSVSLRQVQGAVSELTDTKLPEREVQQIWGLLQGFEAPSLEVHDLRTRKSGATRHIDFHLVVCGQMTVEASHSVCDQMEAKLSEAFLETSINIHVEPCEKEKSQCHLTCPILLKKPGPQN